MLLFRLFLSFLSIVSTVLAIRDDSRFSHSVRERRTIPDGWKNVGAAIKTDTIHLIIGLRQQNQGIVEQHLLEVSDPAHHRYGKYLTTEEIQSIVRPSRDSQDHVMNWLKANGLVGSLNPSKDSVHVLLSIGDAERLLQTSYTTYEYGDGRKVDRALQWSLPTNLHSHVDFIQPTTSFFRANQQESVPVENVPLWTKYDSTHKRRFSFPKAGQGSTGLISEVCNSSSVTPDCIRTLYSTYDYIPQVPHKTGIGHTNYHNGTSYRGDILEALRAFRPEAADAARTFKIINLADANNDQGPSDAERLYGSKNLEAVMDSEAIITIAWPIPLTVWQTGGSPPPFIPSINTPTNTNEPFLVWLDYVLNQKDLPHVISMSFGDDEQTVPESYARRVCSGFAQLGARGISLFTASGDFGVGRNGTCASNDGMNSTRFISVFPASCPWITAVGGTVGFSPEVGTTSFASGAGFSNYFGQPGYQAAAVNSYVKALNGMYDGFFNSSGRAFPDVAAHADNHVIVSNNLTQLGGGTSTSAPIFAAVIALVNDALIARGRPVLGFINPWIYGGGFTALNDVTAGSSYGCDTNGFPAGMGWDAVTGWGTPSFPRLVHAASARKRFGGWDWCDIFSKR